MKHILAILAVLSAFAFAVPTTAKADCGDRRVVSYTACGRPIYATYEVYGYDRCGNPVGQWVTHWFTCSCSTCNPRPYCPPHRDSDYGGSHFYYRSGGGDSCHSSHHRSGFYFSFGR